MFVEESPVEVPLAGTQQTAQAAPAKATTAMCVCVSPPGQRVSFLDFHRQLFHQQGDGEDM